MALFGKLETLKQQVQNNKFQIAFTYLDKVLAVDSEENQRLLALSIDAFENIYLDKNNFALEQVYMSKSREDCFFESHKKYIDIQFILEGEEIIEVVDTSHLLAQFNYEESLDLIKYENTDNASSVRLQKGDVAIFYPKDGHMPCIAASESIKVIKTVVKVQV